MENIKTCMEKINFDQELISEMSFSFMEQIHREKLKTEENCIREVVEKYTGKTLTIEEASKVERIFYMNDYSKYILSYDGVKLGMIRYINSGCNFTVEFTPNEINF